MCINLVNIQTKSLQLYYVSLHKNNISFLRSRTSYVPNNFHFITFTTMKPRREPSVSTDITAVIVAIYLFLVLTRQITGRCCFSELKYFLLLYFCSYLNGCRKSSFDKNK